MKTFSKTNALLFFFGCLFSTSFAQSMQLKNDVLVFANGAQLKNPWTGGLNNPQFSPIDLDRDGLTDMIIFDRTDNKMLPFLNKGASGVIDYVFAPQYIDSLPGDCFGWVLTYDFNNDGKYDIFTGTQISNVKVYRNTSTASELSFAIAADPLRSKYNATGNALNLYIPVNDVPGIGDIDGDGDVDLLTFDVLGSQVEWHKCLSIDSGYSLDTLPLKLQTYCYGHFYEDANTCTAFVNQTPCGPGLRMAEYDEDAFREVMSKTVHSGSTMLIIDLNDDHLQDLVVGDVGCNTLYEMWNNGVPGIANFDSVAGNFPNYDVPVNVPVFPAAFYMDVDNDGVKDLIASPNQVGGSFDVKSAWHYQNVGTTTLPDFRFQKENFMQDGMIEMGTGSAPVFFDYNSDGLLDLLIGNQSEYGVGQPSKLKLYRNRGTAGIPEYVLEDDNYLNLTANPGIENITPTIGDIDGDGDPDLFFGDDDGGIYFYENITTTGTANFVFVTDAYAGISVGTHSAPHLVDYDGDSDLDLLIGNQRGYIRYYKNTGSATAANFVLETDTLGKIKINDFSGQTFSNGFSRPFMFDYDNDLQPELLVGTVGGEVNIYELGTSPSDSFMLAGKLLDFDFGSFSAPCAAVIDSLGATYLVGVQRGGLHLIGQPYPLSVGIDQPVSASNLLEIFPNPANNQISVRFTTQITTGKVQITNLMGQVMVISDLKGRVTTLDVSNLASGVYLVRTETPKGQFQKKLIISK